MLTIQSSGCSFQEEGTTILINQIPPAPSQEDTHACKSTTLDEDVAGV